ncbi:MAG: hypothetical protein M1837_001324 [Sclerophora amabilis]|nr:MAG: hypothetical protein M1837_001324 [Sclerophora amabilis]
MEPLRFEQYPSTHLHLPLRRDILHRAVVYEGDKTRQGTANTKWRKDVHGGGRKIRPQKGTGHARLGDRKSPMLRGGGVAFGPKPRDFSTELPRKVYDLAWRTALSYRYRKGELIIVEDGMEIEHPKTRFVKQIFEANRWGNRDGRSMLVTATHQTNLYKALLQAGEDGRVLTQKTVDVKNLLELGRVIIEKSALDGILKNHQSDLMSTHTEIPKELPGDEVDDVLFNTLYGIRTIELNRPRKLNSLNGSMARKIIPRLKEWEKSHLANVIIMKGAGDKAFCAGGDVAALAEQNIEGTAGRQKSIDYFALEYQLDHLIATYSKPYVAFMDGITMGGGVGLSVHAPIRIATERTVFAMPETTIGFFPDVGGSFFLPRLDGQLGTYLALTSERLTGVNVFYNNIATHYLHSSSLPDLESRLAELTFKDYATLPERLSIIHATISEYSSGLPHDVRINPSGSLRASIDSCFSHTNITDIIRDLESEAATTDPNGNGNSDWARKTLSTISERSPTSVRVALRALRLGRRWSIGETFQREHAIAARFMAHPDFVEGVSARLIRKPAQTPQWQPPTLQATDDAMIDRFFDHEGLPRLRLLNEGAGSGASRRGGGGGGGQQGSGAQQSGDWQEYPHWGVGRIGEGIGLPREGEVEQLVKEGSRTREEVLDWFEARKDGAQGIRKKVGEVLWRKTRVDQGGDRCVWID